MMGDWKTCTIGDLGNVVGGATPSTKKVENYEGGSIAWITPKDLAGFSGRFISHGERNITEQGLKSCSTQLMPKHTVLFSSRAPIGYVAIASGEVCTNQGFKSVVPNDSTDYMFLYYLLKYNKNKIENLGSGTTFKEVSGTTMRGIEVLVPESIYEQRKIASVLAKLDDKIEKNMEINDNLAEQAQGILYHFMDEHPYQLQPLSDIAIVIDCLHSKKPSAVEDSAYQLIQLDNIRDDGFLDMSAIRYMISQADYENWTRKCEIVEGDCVITNVGRIGAVSQAPYGTKAAMGRNMTCIRLKPEIKLQAYFITVLLSNHMRRQIQSNTDEGTIMGALNVKNIPKLLFPVFEPSVMTKLEDILFPLRKQIEYNNLQNQKLSQLRDALLPKLMSGELDVSDIDI
ncbi:type I restriction enzyme, S subunit [Lachnospiraceae bacterium XBB1006]|nr:type I restriction enzyme, S subunit [Lachnospiraceae bacterium XBB1006]